MKIDEDILLPTYHVKNTLRSLWSPNITIGTENWRLVEWLLLESIQTLWKPLQRD